MAHFIADNSESDYWIYDISPGRSSVLVGNTEEIIITFPLSICGISDDDAVDYSLDGEKCRE